jgi:hypothetical protein
VSLLPVDSRIDISLTQKLETQNRRELQTKMASVFQADTKCLPIEFQEALLDDMVTAFENRLVVFKRAEALK